MFYKPLHARSLIYKGRHAKISNKKMKRMLWRDSISPNRVAKLEYKLRDRDLRTGGS